MGWSRHYPESSFTWRFFRRQFLSELPFKASWSEVKAVLKEKRFNGLPKRFRTKAQWWWFKYWVKRYCELFCGSFRVKKVPNTGLGVFTTEFIKKGSLVLFGHLHRISSKASIELEKVGETSLMHLPNKKWNRVDWFYLSGPASLLNHRCRKFNAEYLFDEGRRGENGEFLVRIKRDLAAGEEVLVHYGDEFWEESGEGECRCEDCEENVF